MNKLLFAVGVVAIAMAAPSFAVTGTPGLTTDAANVFDGDGPWTLGWSFDASSAFTLSGLGVFDAGGDGFVRTHEVGLWDGAGNLVASTTVGSGDTLIDGFRYAAIGPIAFAAGHYTVGAADLGVGDPYVYISSISTAAGFTFTNSAYVFGGGLGFPGFSSSDSGYFGGNILIADVPEPASWALMIAGFAMTGFAMRRRVAVAA